MTYLVTQNGNLGYGERRRGFNTKHHSTKAPKGFVKNLIKKDLNWNLASLKDLKPVTAILCTGGPDVIRKEAWPVHRTISGVRLQG